MANVINLIAVTLGYLIDIYSYLIVAWALLTWLPGASQSKLGQLINRVVEPFVSYFNFARIGMIGFGPVLAILALWFIKIGVNGIAGFLINLVG
ncbi:YggT family protein [Fructilactobacillus cliffordii]|uniref:YggT family protein n=1 Tax=Fructilactobacillus cliffordii TaxID=2940299 RepID=A0A9Q8ZXT3_9LACO|nr:YggT family protein [Fructilactobacillus cliffordii]USS86396.1 YggT family protein [Fructilactobacillus cliffordii]USS89461.1 YggT family protein [Fructilactobacillus cliffordii]